MEHTECSKTSAYKVQTPGNYPEESIQRVYFHVTVCLTFVLVLHFKLNIISMSAALTAALIRLPCMYIVVLVTIPCITWVVCQKFRSVIEVLQTQQEIHAIYILCSLHNHFSYRPVEKYSPKGKTSCKGNVQIAFQLLNPIFCFGSKQSFDNISIIQMSSASNQDGLDVQVLQC